MTSLILFYRILKNLCAHRIVLQRMFGASFCRSPGERNRPSSFGWSRYLWF